MRQPSGGSVDPRVPGEVSGPMNGVSVLEPIVDLPVQPRPAVQPSSRILRLARDVARFVHDLLTEAP